MALHSSPVGQTSIKNDEEGVVTVWKNSHHINPEHSLIWLCMFLLSLGLRIGFSVIHGIAFVACRSNKAQKRKGMSWVVKVWKKSHHINPKNSLICLFVYCHWV
jgi:hypothetical protein